MDRCSPTAAHGGCGRRQARLATDHPGHGCARACYRRTPMGPADDSTSGQPPRPPAANAGQPPAAPPGSSLPAHGGQPAKAEKLNTKAAGIVGLAVLCSRLLGLIREQIFAALF